MPASSAIVRSRDEVIIVSDDSTCPMPEIPISVTHPDVVTSLFTDKDETTCLAMFNDDTNTFIAILPIGQIKRTTFYVIVNGKDISCSPLNGLMVRPYSTCGDSYGACAGTYCITMADTPDDDSNTIACRLRCTCSGSCADVLLSVTRFSAMQDSWEICEVAFL